MREAGKKKALPTDDDALVRAARHSSRLRKICHEQKNILSSFFLPFFLSFFLFQGGFLDRNRLEPVGIMINIYRCSVRYYWSQYIVG